LGQPFNSSFNDVSFILSDDQTQGFFATNRDKSYNIMRYEIVGAEQQKLPPEVPQRASPTEVITERPHPVILDNIPPRPAGMPDDIYIAYLDSLVTIGEVDLPRPASSILEDDPLPVVDPGDSPTATTGGQPTVDDASRDDVGVSSVYTDNPDAEAPEDIELTVVLKVMDVANSRPLSNAIVVVRNKFTQEQKEYAVNERGEVAVVLEPFQKYSLIGRSEGYEESSLPVSTMDAVNSDRIQANLPLAKQ
jgi:hypothetical protein